MQLLTPSSPPPLKPQHALAIFSNGRLALASQVPQAQ